MAKKILNNNINKNDELRIEAVRKSAETKKYSVLMSLYKKENPEYLKSSIDSMLNQSVMNSLGNRDISSNLRIIVINNGLGQEFKNYSSYGAIFGDDSDKFIAAKGHFNGRTTPLIECYAECLGFESSPAFFSGAPCITRFTPSTISSM